MDPANFKLLQVTFNEEDLSPDRSSTLSTPLLIMTRSFLHRSQVQSLFKSVYHQLLVDIYSEQTVPFFSFPKTTLPACLKPSACSVPQDFQTSFHQSRGVPQPSRVKVTQIHQQKVWSGLPTTSPSRVTSLHHPTQHFLVNPDSHLDYPTFSSTDISLADLQTLQKVSANTSSAGKHLRRYRFTKMSDASTPPPVQDLDPDGDGTFETVAEALHLQWSVIGNKDITPASPDVVAQIVAEAERKLKGDLTGNQHQEANLHTTVASTILEESLSDSRDSAILESSIDISHRGRNEFLNSNNSAPIHMDLTQTLPMSASMTGGKSSVLGTQDTNLSSNLQSTNGCQSSCAIFDTQHLKNSVIPIVQEIGPPDQIQEHSKKRPLNSLNSGQAKNTSSSIVKDNFLDDIHERTLSPKETATDDTQSVSSGTSDLDGYKDGNTNSAELFLKSLPPVKTVDMNKMESDLKADRTFSPPVKETSFKPLSVDSQLSKMAAENILNLMQSSRSPITNSDQNGNSSGETITDITKQFSKTSIVVPKVAPLFQKRLEMPNKPIVPESTDIFSNIEIETLMRDKAKLEGQLEMLSVEAQETLQERATLQAQVAALQLKLMSHSNSGSEASISNLKQDLIEQQKIRDRLQQSLFDSQKNVEEKLTETKVLQDELKNTQDTADKFQMRIKEVRDDLRTKEMTIQALKNKIAELYVEVQNSLQEKMASDNDARLAKTDLSSAIGAKDWYQKQLETANNARTLLQQEMTNLQAKISAHAHIMEKIKTENTRLRQQLKEVQHKALKEKELLARQLETIEADMMDREAAFQEIQRERTFLEDTFTTKLQSVKEEKSQIPIMMEVTAELESQLDSAQKSLKKKQVQIFSLENEQMELMKNLTLSNESVIEKERILGELEEKLIEMEMQIKTYQTSVVAKDNDILKLQGEKAVTEIALNDALEEKTAVNKSLDTLKVDLGKVEKSFKHLRQELINRDKEIDLIQKEKQKVSDELENIRDELDKGTKQLQSSSKQDQHKTAHITDLQTIKKQLEEEIASLRNKIVTMETAHELALKENSDLQTELSSVKQILVVLEQQLKELKEKEKQVEGEGGKEKEHSVDHLQLESENKKMKERMNQIEKENQKLLTKQKAKIVKLNKDMKVLQDELIARQTSYDSNIDEMSTRLHDVLMDKEKIQLELEMAHRKFDVSLLQQQDQIGAELQTLVTEIQSLKIGKQSVEAQLLELQQLREQEIGHFQDQLSALETELQSSLERRKETQATEQKNRTLDLELEKERGRLAGIMQSNANLKEHVSNLEDALAGRESTLTEFQTQLQTAIHESEQKEEEYLRRIQSLEEAMQKDKASQRDLRKQIGTKITENKRLKRQSESLKSEQQQLQQDVEHHSQVTQILQAELDTNKQFHLSSQAQVHSLEMENRTLTREIERLKMELDDNHSRDPVVQEQISSLQWQLSQKQREIETIQEQMNLVNQRQEVELDSLQTTLQDKQNELDQVKQELAASKQERLNHQTKVSELRTALKASVHHHKLVKKIGKKKNKNSSEEPSRDMGTQVEPDDIPPLPFDLEVMDKLLEETAVKDLESKPLDNIQSCLSILRSEISGLQNQIEAHTITVATTTESWNAVEAGVNELQEVVRTVSDTAMTTAGITSIAAAAVEVADRLSGPGI
ncbi:hypothetical protein ScPMuIL_006468 [Solemya velum]